MISKLWCIELKRSQATRCENTQRGIGSAILQLSRRYRADRVFRMSRLNAIFANGHLIFRCQVTKPEHTDAQVLSHKVGFNATYPMVSSTWDSFGYLYRYFSHDFGTPEHFTFHAYSAQVRQNTLFIKTVRKYVMHNHISSTRRPNENLAEGSIIELKKRRYRIMLNNKVPERSWYYGLVWISKTGNLSV